MYIQASEAQTSTHHIIYTCTLYVCNTCLRGSDQYSSHNLYMYVCNTGLRGSDQYSSHNLYMYVCNTGLRGSNQYSSHNLYLMTYIYVYIQASDQCSTIVMELKLKALILDAVHNIEIVRMLLSHVNASVSSWQWQKQLRFYLRNGERGVCACVRVCVFSSIRSCSIELHVVHVCTHVQVMK